jgi:hypothetical protein
VGLTTLPCKKKIVEKPRNSDGFYGGGQGLSWAVEQRKEEEEAVSDPAHSSVVQLIVTQLVKNSPSFIEPDGSSSCSVSAFCWTIS